jgi:hypothetical protein
MSVNKIKVVKSITNKQLDIPIELKWDFQGQEDSIDKWQEETVEKIIGKPKDFELARFQNKVYPNGYETQVIYNFNFYSGFTNLSDTANESKWGVSYTPQEFTNNEIYYTVNSFKNSFFKLDFYDTNDGQTQTNYFSVILPANQSSDLEALISDYLPPVKISYPSYTLDFINQKEGYFFYWLKSRDFLNIDTFYMSAKFFNGKTGQFISMTNTCQGNPILSSNRYKFDSSKYFYYKVKLNYSDFTYQIFNYTTGADVRVGSSSAPINWFQYTNPI